MSIYYVSVHTREAEVLITWSNNTRLHFHLSFHLRISKPVTLCGDNQSSGSTIHTTVIAAGNEDSLTFLEKYCNTALPVNLIPISAVALIIFFFYHLLSLACILAVYNHPFPGHWRELFLGLEFSWLWCYIFLFFTAVFICNKRREWRFWRTASTFSAITFEFIRWHKHFFNIKLWRVDVNLEITILSCSTSALDIWLVVVNGL